MPNDLFDAPTSADPTVNAPVSNATAPATQVTQPSTSAPATETKTEPKTNDTTQSTPQTAPAAPQPTQQGLTDEQIGQLADKFFAKVTKPAQAPKNEKFELTPELAESLKPVRVTPQLLASLGFEGATPEQVAGFQTFADAIVTHAAHVSSFLQQRALQELSQTYQPYVGYIQEQQRSAHRTSFFSENKDLQKYEKFVSFAAERVNPVKADGSEKSAKEISTEVATATRQLLKEAGINLDSQSNANQVTPSTTSVPKMPTLDAGGGSMSGSNQGKNTKPSIFDDL